MAGTRFGEYGTGRAWGDWNFEIRGLLPVGAAQTGEIRHAAVRVLHEPAHELETAFSRWEALEG